MATYTLISSNVLSSTAASVTFSAIPATYTDLVVRCSVRTSYAGTEDYILVRVNGITSSVYSATNLNGTGTTVNSDRLTSATYTYFLSDAANNTANTFCNTEIYFPSYLASQNKPFSIFSVEENNSSGTVMSATAGLYGQTTAISSISFTPFTGPNISIGSSFYLYGISNA
jgi:hypothetical protein